MDNAISVICALAMFTVLGILGYAWKIGMIVGAVYLLHAIFG
jgi:hypothetical protein